MDGYIEAAERMEAERNACAGIPTDLLLNHDAQQAVRELRRQRDELLAVVKSVEWGGLIDYGEDPCCPQCFGLKETGKHKPDCRLANTLADCGVTVEYARIGSKPNDES